RRRGEVECQTGSAAGSLVLVTSPDLLSVHRVHLTATEPAPNPPCSAYAHVSENPGDDRQEGCIQQLVTLDMRGGGVGVLPGNLGAGLGGRVDAVLLLQVVLWQFGPCRVKERWLRHPRGYLLQLRPVLIKLLMPAVG